LAVKLPARFHAELDGELEPGETVLWTGVPRRSRLARRAVAAVAFPLLWNGFALLLVYGAAKEGGLLSFFAVPFLVVGLPLFQAPLEAVRVIGTTFYAVTDRRAILFDGEDILALSREKLARVASRVRADGSGDLWLMQRPRGRGDERVGLLGIARVHEVETLLLDRAS